MKPTPPLGTHALGKDLRISRPPDGAHPTGARTPRTGANDRPLPRLPAALFLVTLTACSGSSKEDTTAADTGASDATDTGSGEDTGNTDSGDTANTDSGDTATTDTEDTAAQGACQNEADLAIHGDPAYHPFEKSVSCGLDSISLLLSANWDAFAAAFSTCMSDPTYRGDSRFAFTLTEACTDCYGAHVRCVAEF